MKRLALLGVLVLSFAATAAADIITFNFVVGPPGSLTASATGLSSGPASNVLVTDVTTGMSVTQLGTFTSSAGPASSFTPFPPFVIATYTAGGANSVQIVDPMMNPLVTGSMMSGGALLTAFPNGQGAFLGDFNVTFVSPAVLAMFGLPPGWEPVGAVAITFAHDNFDGTTVTGNIGGGTVTIVSVVPEPASLGVLGMGLLAVAEGLRRRRGSLRA